MPARTENAVLVSAPLELVWSAMNDVENWPNLFTEYASVEILAREGDTTRFRLTTHPDPEHGGQVWTWVSERTVDAASHRSHAERIETGPFEYMRIDWSFKPVVAGTEMRWVQEFAMKPDAPADDAAAADYVNRNTRIQMSSVKERLEASARTAG
jgi:aromatase